MTLVNDHPPAPAPARLPLVDDDAALRQAVYTHIRLCQACCGVFARYCSVQQVLTALQDPRDVEEPLQRAQARLTQRLVRQPVVHCSYYWCSTVLGKLCIAQSEHGVSLVTWETHAARFLTRLERQAGVAVLVKGEALTRYAGRHEVAVEVAFLNQKERNRGGDMQAGGETGRILRIVPENFISSSAFLFRVYTYTA